MKSWTLRLRMGWFLPSTTCASTRPNETSLRKVAAGLSACGVATAAVWAANRNIAVIDKRTYVRCMRDLGTSRPYEFVMWAKLFRLRCSRKERSGKFLIIAAPECKRYYLVSE